VPPEAVSAGGRDLLALCFQAGQVGGVDPEGARAGPPGEVVLGQPERDAEGRIGPLPRRRDLHRLRIEGLRDPESPEEGDEHV
jgi:hypothetical protein